MTTALTPPEESPLILVVDDDPTSLTLLADILAEPDYHVIFGTRGAEALELVGQQPDLILLDYHLPDFDGLEVCRLLKADPMCARIPIVFITANQDPVLEARGLEAGAVDFVTKPYSAAVLRARVNTHVAMRRALDRLQQTHDELRRAYVELHRLASTDKLTGAWNRRHLETSVIGEMERLRRYDHPLSLILLDIDFFKTINDRHGHLTGDQVLVELAETVRSVLRATDALTRWGGEEFIVLVPNAPLETATLLAERLRATIAATPFAGIGTITVSLGVAECLPEETWEQWLRRADAALYRAKSGGRDRVALAPERPARIAGGGDRVTASFVQLAWHPAYDCGHPLIDSQHRALFADANRLLEAMLSERPADEIAGLVRMLMRDVIQHFQDEERIIAAAGYPDAAAHAACHRALVERAGHLAGQFQAGTLAIGTLFEFLARDVVALHMLRADRAFFPYLNPVATEPGPCP